MRKKVAVVTTRFPHPLTKGDSLRLYYQIREVSKYVDVHLFSIVGDWPSKDSQDALRPFCCEMHLYKLPVSRSRRQVLKSFFTKLPMQVGYFYDPAIKDMMLHEIIHLHPDYIHCHLIRSFPYVTALSDRFRVSLDYMDSMSLNDLVGQKVSGPMLGLIRQYERAKVVRYEEHVGQLVHKSWVISSRDRDQLPHQVRCTSEILSNGVDDSFFYPMPQRYGSTYDLCFVGNLSYKPNQRAVKYLVEEILPLMPEVRLYIAGKDASEDLINLQHQQAHVAGYIEDIREAYHVGRITIVPIFTGSGQQNKVLEAMACGRPVVTTSFVNESILANPEQHVLIADTPEVFVKQVKRLISQPDLQMELGQKAREFVIEHFSWGANTKPLIKYLTS